MNTRIFILAFVALTVCGCASSFTSIERREDGTYTLTRIKQNPFNVGSNVYHCTAEGLAMTCNIINE